MSTFALIPKETNSAQNRLPVASCGQPIAFEFRSDIAKFRLLQTLKRTLKLLKIQFIDILLTSSLLRG